MHRRLTGILLAAGVFCSCRPATVEPANAGQPGATPAHHAGVTTPTCPAKPHAQLQRSLDNGDDRGDHHPQFRHLSLSPDGRRLAASNDVHTVLFDVESGAQVASVHGGSAVFTPAGEGLFVAYREALVHIRLSDLAEGDQLVLPAPMPQPPRVVLTPTGEHVVAYAEYIDAPLQVWDLQTRAPRCTARDPLGPVAFAAQTGAAWACHGRELVEWDPRSCAVLRRHPSPGCDDLTVSSDGTRVAITTGKLLLFDAIAQQWVPHYLEDPSLVELTALADGTLLVAGGGLRRFDPHGDRPGARDVFLPTTGLSATGLAVAADESVVVALFEDHRGREPAQLRRWSLRERRYFGDLPDHPRMLAPTILAPAGATFLVQEASLTLHLHLTATGERLASYTVLRPGIGFSPDGGRLVIRGKDALMIHDGHTGDFVGTLSDLPQRRYGNTSRAVVLSPDAAHVFLGEEHGDHLLIDLAGGARRDLRAHTAAAGEIDAVFSPDGGSLLIRSAVGQIILWDVRSRRRLRSFGDATLRFGAQPFSADSRRIVLDGAGEVLLFDAAVSRPRRRIRGFTRSVLSPDGRHLLAIDAAGRPALLDSDSGEPTQTFSVDQALAVAFLGNDHVEVATSHQLSTWSLAGTRMTVHSIPFSASHARLADGRRLAIEDQALVLYAADGPPAAGFAVTADGAARVAWTPDGAWDGDETLLRFTDGFTPCTGSPARHPDLWVRALATASPPTP